MSAAERGQKWIKPLGFAFGGVVTGAFCLVTAVCLVPLPTDLLRPVEGTLKLVDCHARLLAAIASPQARAQTPVPLDEMGQWLPAVTIALEDHRFSSHHGIDLQAAVAALCRNVEARRIVSGGSTITQQVIKLASGRSHRSWRAKLYENLAAIRLES